MSIHKAHEECSTRIRPVVINDTSVLSLINISALKYFEMHNLCTLPLNFADYPQNSTRKIAQFPIHLLFKF